MAKERIRDIRCRELIEAAIHATHAKGYAVVTMTEIADHAESTAASINYYFGSKERLMEATMLHLLAILKNSLLIQYRTANNARERLDAVLNANFDDRLFTNQQCSFWMQFWSHAPYDPRLIRLQRINRARVRSSFRAELRQLLPDDTRETVREALQAYMDGVWLRAAQSDEPLNAAASRAQAGRLVDLLLENGGYSPRGNL